MIYFQPVLIGSRLRTYTVERNGQPPLVVIFHSPANFRISTTRNETLRVGPEPSDSDFFACVVSAGKVYKNDRYDYRARGIIIAIKNYIQSSFILVVSLLKNQWVATSTGFKKCLVGVCYRTRRAKRPLNIIYR